MKNLTNTKDRILFFIENQGIKISKFYSESGVSYGILSQKSKITEDNIVRFLIKYPQVSAEWLLTGKGPMLRPPELMSEAEMARHDKEVADGKWQVSSVAPTDINVVVELSTRLGEQTNENKHLHRANMELAAQVEGLKKEVDSLKEQIRGLKKESKPYALPSEPLLLAAEPGPPPLVKRGKKQPQIIPRNPAGRHHFGTGVD